MIHAFAAFLAFIVGLIGFNYFLTVLIHIKKQLKTIMATQEQLNEAIAKLDAATTEIASDLKKLRDQIANGTVTDESLAKLNANIAKLEGLGAEDGETDPDEETE